MNDPFFDDISKLKRQAAISSRPGQCAEIETLAVRLKVRYERQLENHDTLRQCIDAALAQLGDTDDERRIRRVLTGDTDVPQ